MLWKRLPWLSKSVAGGRRIFVNLDTCQRYIFLYINFVDFFCTKRTSESQRFKRGGKFFVLKVNLVSFTLVWLSNEESTLSTLRFYNQFFKLKNCSSKRRCIDEFCSSKIRWLPLSVLDTTFLHLILKWDSMRCLRYKRICKCS